MPLVTAKGMLLRTVALQAWMASTIPSGLLEPKSHSEYMAASCTPQGTPAKS